LVSLPLTAGGGPKKEQKKQSGGSKSKIAEADITVAKLDIRVGLIRKAEKHPDADSLYVEEIDVGEDTPRTVVSGLVKFIPLEEMQVALLKHHLVFLDCLAMHRVTGFLTPVMNMQNRKVCVLCNLKPVAMRGIKSHAMVLAASNEDHTKVRRLSYSKSDGTSFSPQNCTPSLYGGTSHLDL
jgi:methionyl-tRNA synthetase